jgi:hypothetical protein
MHGRHYSAGFGPAILLLSTIRQNKHPRGEGRVSITIEVKNCTTDRTISGVIVTWDETPFTRFIDKEFSRDCLLSPSSLEPSSAASVLLFKLKDDFTAKENKSDALGWESTFTIRASGIGTGEAAARFRYEPDKIPKLRRLWR